MKAYKDFTLPEWLHELEQRHPQEIHLGLERIHQVALSLGLLKPEAIVISVAGTNGKGSTVACLEAIYLAGGYQVASYTSPHLLYFNERIKVNQQPISDACLCSAFTAIEEARKEVMLSYFEMTTLAALWYFKKHALQLIILEVGLGGRLDATNIIYADLALITTIDLDHEAFLGTTLEEIAFEKAGIMRAAKPVIYADHHPPKNILKQAEYHNAPLFCLGENYNYKVDATEMIFNDLHHSFKIRVPRLHPNSVAAAIQASIILNSSLPLTSGERAKGLQSTCLQGRLELFNGKVQTLVDVAHNPQATRYLAGFIEKIAIDGKVHAVFSAFKDKDLLAMVQSLSQVVNYWYPALLSGARATEKEQLEQALNTLQSAALCYPSPLDAYEAACRRAVVGDLIVVFGSFMVVEPILSALDRCKKIEEVQ